MSAKYTFLAWDTPVNDASTKLALLQLANNADDNGFSYYSISKMAQACDMSDRNFMRKIKKLEDLKILKVERRANRPSLYTLVGDEMGVTICHLQDSGVTSCHAGVTSCHAEGDRLSHDPNNTPNTNPNSSLVEPSAKPRKYKFNDDQMNFANAVLGKVIVITPAMKLPNIESWANSARLISEIDGVDLNHAWEVFCWANADSFWSTNILSVAKLRDKYAVLCAKMNGKQTGAVDIMQQSANSDWHKGDLGL